MARRPSISPLQAGCELLHFSWWKGPEQGDLDVYGVLTGGQTTCWGPGSPPSEWERPTGSPRKLEMLLYYLSSSYRHCIVYTHTHMYASIFFVLKVKGIPLLFLLDSALTLRQIELPRVENQNQIV